jgi:hypothetical protein
MRNLIISLIAFVLISCNDKNFNMSTEILKDGSCIRKFTATADSAFMVGDTNYNPFPVKLDHNWKISYVHPDSSGKVSNVWPVKSWISNKDTSIRTRGLREMKISVTRKFSNVKAMQDSFLYSKDWENVHPKITLEKKFKWFYTTYSFREIYPKYNMLNYVPIEKYLTRDDLKWYFSENPKFPAYLTGKEIKDTLDHIDKQVNAWLGKNIFEESFLQLTTGIQKFEPGNPYLQKIILAKDTLFQLFNSDKPLEGDLGKAIQKHLKIKKIFINYKTEKEIDDFSKDKTDAIFATIGKQSDYELVMPGNIIETNSNLLDAKKLNWKIDGDRFFFLDYEIYAKSRVANVWAFVLSGIFIVLVVLSFFIRKKRI